MYAESINSEKDGYKLIFTSSIEFVTLVWVSRRLPVATAISSCILEFWGENNLLNSRLAYIPHTFRNLMI